MAVKSVTEHALTVTVAIPVLNGGERLIEVLEAVRSQSIGGSLELLVCDSGSTDRSISRAKSFGARVIEIPAAEFSHGGTRNLLMEEATGDHVAFLTQDSTPADSSWLSRLLGGFMVADDVALVHGPYLPRQGAEAHVARELHQHFASFSDGSEVAIDLLGPMFQAAQHSSPTQTALSPAGLGSKCHFLMWLTPRTACWQKRCFSRASQRSSNRGPPSFIHTITDRVNSLAATSTNSEGCAKRSATSSRPPRGGRSRASGGRRPPTTNGRFKRALVGGIVPRLR